MTTDTDTGKDNYGAILMAAMAASGGDGMAKLIASLPLETRCPPFPLRQLGGFWLPDRFLPGLAAVHRHFEPRQDDVFLASFPKSGTTWLKALVFATLNRAQHPPSDPGHPLHLRSPHDCVKFLEPAFDLADDGNAARAREDVFKAFPSPRVLATHAPYHLLSERVTAESAGCRIVYVCRDPKDVLVSGWLFTTKSTAAAAKAAGDDVPPPPPYPLEEAFELFCDGRCIFGPPWRHVLGYWEESRRRPDKVLFLRYEDMLRDPLSNLKRLAEFMGCPFSGEEAAAGVVDAIVELCSLDSLKESKGNQSGTTPVPGLDIENGLFFRKGAAGDWRNHLSPEMGARLDAIVNGALQASGFAFGVAAADSV